MTAEQLRELINRDVDGDLSPSEHRTLSQALRRNAAARRLHAEITEIGTRLASVRQAEVPANLGARIRADVRSRMAPARRTQSSWLESLRNLVLTPTVLRYGSVFAGGAVCGAILFMLLLQPQPAPAVSGDVATGTLLSQSESFPVNLDGAKGVVSAVPTETGKEVTFRLACGAETTTKVTFDPSRVKLENVREVQSSGGPVLVNEGVVSMTGTGSQRCTLTFSGVKDSRIAVQVSTAGGGSFRTEVQVH